MQCPHCSIAFRDVWDRRPIKYDNGRDSNWYCITTVCPECHSPSIKIEKIPSSTGIALVDMVGKARVKEHWVYPTSRRGRRFGDEVVDDLKSDYFEACETLLISPKSSATISRRIVEAVLRQQGYRQDRLQDQIKAVRNEPNPDKKLPVVLSRIIDAVREFGNFSAHEKKNLTTLQIVEVEPGEADLCLEIVEALFEHYYLRPVIDAKRLEKVNEKLQQVGKGPL